MKLALACGLVIWPALAAAAPRGLPAPAPVRAVSVTPVIGPKLRVSASPSPAAPRRMLLVGNELWLAGDGGVARLPSDLRSDRPAWVRDATGASLGAVYDLQRVGGEVWAATDHGVVRIDPRGRVIARALADRHVVGLDEGGLAATDQGVVRVLDGGVVDPALDVHALVRCGAAHYGIAGGRLLGLGHAAPELGPATAISLGCVDGELVVGTDEGLRWTAGAFGSATGGPVTTITSSDGVVAQGTLGGLRFASRRNLSPHTDEPGRVWAIAAGRGAWWAAIEDELVRMSPSGEIVRSIELVGPRGFIMAVEADGDAAWVGTFDDGLYRLQDGRYRRVPTPDRRITSLLTDRDRLLVGTAGGLFAIGAQGVVEHVRDPLGRLERHISTLRRLGPRILVGAYPGAVILGADGEMRYLTGRGTPLTTPREEQGFATTVFGAVEQAGALWLATQDGIERHDRGGAAIVAAVGGVLPDDWVNDVGVIGDELFFVLADRGVGWLGPRGTTLANAHLPTSCGSLRALGDRAVFAADGGLVTASHHDELPSLVRYDAAQGVDLVVVTLALDEGADRLWLGGVGGVLRVDHVRAQLAEERAR